MFKRIKSEKRGAISILLVIFILTLVGAFSLLLDLSYTMFGMREIQSKMDMAGINALYSSIDIDRLRNEDMGVVGGGYITSTGTSNLGDYRTVIKNAYVRELANIKYHGEKPTIRKANVSFEYSNFGLGYNAAINSSGARKRPQIVLESIVSYSVPASTLVDDTTKNITKKVDSVHTGTQFSVTVSDVGVDGRKTVLVHSITRVVLK